jgi:hypothetical protein
MTIKSSNKVKDLEREGNNIDKLLIINQELRLMNTLYHKITNNKLLMTNKITNDK